MASVATLDQLWPLPRGCLMLLMLLQFRMVPNSAVRKSGLEDDGAAETNGTWRSQGICLGSGGPRFGNAFYIFDYMFTYAIHQRIRYVKTTNLGQFEEILNLSEVIDVKSGSGVASAVGGHIDCDYTCQHFGDCHQQFGEGALRQIGGTEVQRLLHANPSALRCEDISDNSLGNGGLVIHMRSGDIMAEHAGSGYYAQPPCSWYVRVAEQGNNGGPFLSVLIVTEPDMRNPCIEHVRSNLPNVPEVRVQSTSIREDGCMLALAQNLVISFGTWGPSLAVLNLHLKHIHIPFGPVDAGPDAPEGGYFPSWYKKIVVDTGVVGITQSLWSFPGYKASWDSWADREAKMIGYSGDLLVERVVPALETAR